MNFYKHHLGDYAADTSHLSWDEDCAYRRLIDAYYKREQPIPVDIKEACRLVRATTPAQRRAVESVLREFFVLTETGWRQRRCEAEIAAANAQAETNRRIAEDREARRRARIEHESLKDSGNEPSTNRSPAPPGSVNLARLQTPDTTSQTPDSTQGDLAVPPNPPASAGPAPVPTKRAPKGKPEPVSTEVWSAYALAYEERYGATPVRNAKVNGQLAQVVQRLGADESPGVARFFVGHQNALYVRAMHPVDLLLRDAEKLRTEWATGRQVTHAQAVLTDRTQTNANAFGPMIEAARRREEEERHA